MLADQRNFTHKKIPRNRVHNLIGIRTMYSYFRKVLEKVPPLGSRTASYYASSSGAPNQGIFDSKGHPVLVRALCDKVDCESKLCPKICGTGQAETDIGNLTHKPPAYNNTKAIIHHPPSNTWAVVDSHSSAQDYPTGTVVPDPSKSQVVDDLAPEIHNHISP